MLTVRRSISKPKVSPEWELLTSFWAYDKYLTGRDDVVRLAKDPVAHVGNLAYAMAGRVWLHTLCGITYAVYPDPLATTLRHDVALPTRYPPGAMSCARCEEWKREDEDGEP